MGTRKWYSAKRASMVLVVMAFGYGVSMFAFADVKPSNGLKPAAATMIADETWSALTKTTVDSPTIMTRILHVQYKALVNERTEMALRKDMLSVFAEAKAWWVCREVLLVDAPDLVLVAAKRLADVNDVESVPYLIAAMRKNNYIHEGSEDATVHRQMKMVLIEAAAKIAGTPATVKDINVDNRDEVESAVRTVEAWARQKGIALPHWHDEKKPAVEPGKSATTKES